MARVNVSELPGEDLCGVVADALREAGALVPGQFAPAGEIARRCGEMLEDRCSDRTVEEVLRCAEDRKEILWESRDRAALAPARYPALAWVSREAFAAQYALDADTDGCKKEYEGALSLGVRILALLIASAREHKTLTCQQVSEKLGLEADAARERVVRALWLIAGTLAQPRTMEGEMVGRPFPPLACLVADSGLFSPEVGGAALQENPDGAVLSEEDRRLRLNLCLEEVFTWPYWDGLVQALDADRP